MWRWRPPRRDRHPRLEGDKCDDEAGNTDNEPEDAPKADLGELDEE
ncbi:hypothetical protein ACTWQF_22325 [Streptomyces sp. 8N114]